MADQPLMSTFHGYPMVAAAPVLDPVDLSPTSRAWAVVCERAEPDQRGRYVTWLVCPHQEHAMPLHYVCDTGTWDLTLPDALADMARRANIPAPSQAGASGEHHN
ncbi:MAG: hypothetical protein ACRDTQ_16750 [Micromonosporaceae bacterium]